LERIRRTVCATEVRNALVASSNSGAAAVIPGVNGG
jgi:hypothetical protein